MRGGWYLLHCLPKSIVTSDLWGSIGLIWWSRSICHEEEDLQRWWFAAGPSSMWWVLEDGWGPLRSFIVLACLAMFFLLGLMRSIPGVYNFLLLCSVFCLRMRHIYLRFEGSLKNLRPRSLPASRFRRLELLVFSWGWYNVIWDSIWDFHGFSLTIHWPYLTLLTNLLTLVGGLEQLLFSIVYG